MSDAGNAYVQTDDHGVMRVGKKRVMLDGIVAAFWEGHSPEAIRQQYPALTLEEAYGAIAYYLARQEEIDAYLAKQRQEWDRIRRELGPSPVLERLRALRDVSVSEPT